MWLFILKENYKRCIVLSVILVIAVRPKCVMLHSFCVHSWNTFAIQDNELNGKSIKSKRHFDDKYKHCFCQEVKVFKITNADSNMAQWAVLKSQLLPFVFLDSNFCFLEILKLFKLCYNTQNKGFWTFCSYSRVVIYCGNWWKQHIFFLFCIFNFSLLSGFSTHQFKVKMRPPCLHRKMLTAGNEALCCPTCYAIIVLMPLITNIVS